MSRSFRRKSRALRALSIAALGFAAASSAAAQQTLSGPLSDATTGPLTAGNVYMTAGSISVPLGQTLTIEPGVIIKFSFSASFTVNGRLLANGTGSDSIIFTDIRDDSVGGDTNGDGSASIPSPSYWSWVRLEPTADDSVLSGVTVRYSGRAGAAFRLSDSSATLVDCAAEDSGNDGFDLLVSSRPTLTRCSSLRSGGVAFDGVALQALAGFTGLAASGGTNGDFLNVTSASLAPGENVTVMSENLLGRVGVLNTSVNVPAGARLLVGRGSVLKWGFSRRCIVDGELDIDGIASSPVIMTDLRDDTIGGDTNGDGSLSTPSPAWWSGVEIRPSATGCELNHTELRFAGRAGFGIRVETGDAVLRDCVITSNSSNGLDLNGVGRPTVEGLVVHQTSGVAVHAAPIAALAGFSGMDLSGGSQSYVEVAPSTVSSGETISIEASNGHDNAFVFPGSLIIEPGAQLNIGPDVICKMAFATRVQADGVLEASGISGAPVIFTELRDDSVAGDTNGDGDASQPSIGYWTGLVFSDASDGSHVARTEVRYAGRNGAAIRASDASITLERCRVVDVSGLGVDLTESTEPCILDRILIERSNGSAGIGGVRLDRIGDITLPRGDGNTRNAIRVTEGLIAEDTTIELRNLWNGALLISDNVDVPSGLSLVIEPGVVVKMAFSRSINVDGALSTRGSFDQSVVFTEERDDSAAGDTNGDAAASAPSRGYWNGVNLRSTTDTSILQGLEVRYAGRSGVSVNVTGGRAILQEARIDESSGDGLRLDGHPITLERVAISNCSSDGLDLIAGSFDVRQVTAIGCSRFGLNASAAFSGTVSDSILRGNNSGDVNGIAISRVTYSNGDGALGTGSISADPLFFDAAGGNLRPTAGSPGIDTGAPASPLDPDSTRADMGAYFLNACEPLIACVQSENFGPCIPTIGFEGFASASRPEPFLITLNDAPTASFGTFFYSVGQPALIAALFGDLCVSGPYMRTPAISSGGDPADGPCAGRMEFDMNAFIQSGADASLAPGVTAIGHFWFRYGAAPGGSRFSDGVEIAICP